MLFDEMMWSPVLAIFNMHIKFAACPDDVHIAPVPPSSRAMCASKLSTVGFPSLE